MSAERLMVIDDEPLVRATLKAILMDAGYDVTVAANGRDGLRQLGARRVDLVVTDILMPEMEGIETIRAIRRRHPDVKIVAISGGVGVEGSQLLDSAGKLGAHQILAKSSVPDQIVGTVEALLQT
ncbi:MAG: response regulator [Dongiaceae bacterium]